MHSRSSATTEIAVTSGPIRRSVDISWMAPAVRKPEDPSWDRPSHIPAEPREIDARLYMFALCKHLQTICLNRRGIDCLFDADSVGRLSETVCRMLGLMVCELVEDVVKGWSPEISGEMITVTLRRRGTTCLCTVSHRGLADARAQPQPGLQRVQSLARHLPGCCMVRPMTDGRMVAIMFDVHLVERCIPAAIRRYRAGEAWHRAAGHSPAVPE
jgi:hypothetical protein